jgi:hypothetical protein
MTDDRHADTAYHMRLLVDRVPTMLAYWDRDLTCRFANRAYEINDSSRKIADIIGVIDGIAFQTNILALNAAQPASSRARASARWAKQ